MTYKSLLENTQNPHSAPIRDRSQRDTRRDPLADYSTWPMGEKTRDPIFIRKHKTTRNAVELCLAEFKYNYVVHVFEEVRYEISPDKQDCLEKLMLDDPLGLKPIPKTNTDCWTVRRIGVPLTAEAVGEQPSLEGNLGTSSSQEDSSSSEEDAPSSSEEESGTESAKASSEQTLEASTASAKAPSKQTLAKGTPTKPAGKGKKSRKKKKKKPKKKKRVAFKDLPSKKGGTGKTVKNKSKGSGDTARVSLPNVRTTPEEAQSKRTFVKTPLYTTLLRLNGEYYKYIRASIFRFMGKDAKEYLTDLIDQEETNRGIQFEHRADAGVRLPWAWIEATILDKICPQTLGDYYFRSLLTMFRRNNEMRSNWCKRVTSAQNAIIAYKHGWEGIGCRSAVHKLWGFLSDKGQVVVWKHYR